LPNCLFLGLLDDIFLNITHYKHTTEELGMGMVEDIAVGYFKEQEG
jgi:hypothetical protein